jgi:hypothetical protein
VRWTEGEGSIIQSEVEYISARRVMQSELSWSFVRSVVVCATNDRASRVLYGASGAYLRRNREHAYVLRYIEFTVKVLHRFVCKRIIQYSGSNIIINPSFWNIRI